MKCGDVVPKGQMTVYDEARCFKYRGPTLHAPALIGPNQYPNTISLC